MLSAHQRACVVRAWCVRGACVRACVRARACLCVCKSVKLGHIWKAACRQYGQELPQHISKENSHCHFLRVHNPEPAQSLTHFRAPFRYDSHGIIIPAKSGIPRYYNLSRFDNQNSYIPTVHPTRCTCYLKLFILVKRSTCFGRSFRPSSGAQNCV